MHCWASAEFILYYLQIGQCDLTDMRKVIPYSLPLLFSLVFVSTAHSDWLWLSPILLFLAGIFTPSVGEFTSRQVAAEYTFFHYSHTMALFKRLNGVLFMLLNGWAFYFLASQPLSVWHLLVFTYGMSILNSNFSISLAHDLMHSRALVDRGLSSILLLQNGFFYLEADHLYIHHRHVGTEQDPATPRLGEPIYSYFRRSFRQRIGLLFNRNRLLSTADRRRIIRLTILKLGVCATYLTLGAFIRPQVFCWILGQYSFVILVYESITYIQHYGLRRMKRENTYAPIQLHHAWNSFYKLNTYLYFMMPVHSLHHMANPDLNAASEFAGPRMPLPFARMLLMAYQPTRWFALMDKMALQVQATYQPTNQ